MLKNLQKAVSGRAFQAVPEALSTWSMLITESLKDIPGGPVQPMTLANYPVKIELWVGTAEDQKDFKPEILVDSLCFNEEKIEYGYAYYFYDCP